MSGFLTGSKGFKMKHGETGVSVSKHEGTFYIIEALLHLFFAFLKLKGHLKMR